MKKTITIKNPTKKEIMKWANQQVVIKCTMREAGDLMDILFMADSGPIDADFMETLKLNKLIKQYHEWLNRMVTEGGK
jgi:hypothetical protein